MDVILLERIAKLGQMGDVVSVKNGFARNFLLPQNKALRATDDNRKDFEARRSTLEARNLELKTEAEAVAVKLAGQTLVAIRQAGDTGQLYGSVSSRDIAELASAAGFELDRRQIELQGPIKALGVHAVAIQLHPEVSVDVNVNVARSADEADRQARGEDVTLLREEALELETFDPEGMDEDDDDDDRGRRGGNRDDDGLDDSAVEPE